MAKKSSEPSSRGRAEEGTRTRALLVEAGLRTLIEQGYGGSSARAIAGRAGLNPALIFYHFGGVDDLLLAALDRSSEERLQRYRTETAELGDPADFIRRTAELFREDVEGGHVTAITEMLGACLSRPHLRAQLVARMQPWTELAEGVLVRLLERTHLPMPIPTGEPAYAIVAGYLGLNLLSRLQPDLDQTDRLFELGEQLARFAERLSTTPPSD
jgi:AcrR family transcriptional regulator